jgi:hypothetical protein
MFFYLSLTMSIFLYHSNGIYVVVHGVMIK